MMKQKVLYVFVAALFSTAGMAQNTSTSDTYGDGNVSITTQVGNGLTADIDQGTSNQPSNFNKATIIQGSNADGIPVDGVDATNSYDSEAKIVQTGGTANREDPNHTATIIQLGRDNNADISQSGTHHTATITQVGDSNASDISEGVDNFVKIDQSGSDHKATIAQTGNSNDADITQDGNGDTATITQTGDLNDADITQTGDNNVATIGQTGNDHYADIDQSGNFNNTEVTQATSYNKATIDQSGNYNKAIVNQSGLGLSGALNTVDIDQNNDGNWASATQTDVSGNTINITQTSNSSSATVLATEGGGLNSTTALQDGTSNTITVNQTLTDS